jgi:hypothetical protein
LVFGVYRVNQIAQRITEIAALLKHGRPQDR